MEVKLWRLVATKTKREKNYGWELSTSTHNRITNKNSDFVVNFHVVFYFFLRVFRWNRQIRFLCSRPSSKLRVYITYIAFVFCFENETHPSVDFSPFMKYWNFINTKKANERITREKPKMQRASRTSFMWMCFPLIWMTMMIITQDHNIIHNMRVFLFSPSSLFSPCCCCCCMLLRSQQHYM